jgi:hypothetical protein
LEIQGIEFFGPVEAQQSDTGSDLGVHQDQFIFHAPKIKAREGTDP